MSKLHQVFGIVHVDLPVAVARSSLGGVAVRYIPVLPVLRMTSCWSIIGHDVGDVSAASTHNDSPVSGTGQEMESNATFALFQPTLQSLARPSAMFCSCNFLLLMVHSHRIYWGDLYQIFRTHRHMTGDDVLRSLKDVVNVTDFGAHRRKLAYAPSFFALAFHNGREDRNSDGHVNNRDDRSTRIKSR